MASDLAHETLEKLEVQRARDEEDWWSWELRARRETDLKKREQIYREGVDRLKRSVELKTNFGLFLIKEAENYDEGEKQYREAPQDQQKNIAQTNFFRPDPDRIVEELHGSPVGYLRLIVIENMRNNRQRKTERAK